jgi:hypothetical protein
MSDATLRATLVARLQKYRVRDVDGWVAVIGPRMSIERPQRARPGAGAPLEIDMDLSRLGMPDAVGCAVLETVQALLASPAAAPSTGRSASASPRRRSTWDVPRELDDDERALEYRERVLGLPRSASLGGGSDAGAGGAALASRLGPLSAAAAASASVTGPHTFFVALRMCDNALTGAICPCVVALLGATSRVRTLDFTGNRLGAEAVTTLLNTVHSLVLRPNLFVDSAAMLAARETLVDQNIADVSAVSGVSSADAGFDSSAASVGAVANARSARHGGSGSSGAAVPYLEMSAMPARRDALIAAEAAMSLSPPAMPTRAAPQPPVFNASASRGDGADDGADGGRSGAGSLSYVTQARPGSAPLLVTVGGTAARAASSSPSQASAHASAAVAEDSRSGHAGSASGASGYASYPLLPPVQRRAPTPRAAQAQDQSPRPVSEPRRDSLSPARAADKAHRHGAEAPATATERPAAAPERPAAAPARAASPPPPPVVHRSASPPAAAVAIESVVAVAQSRRGAASPATAAAPPRRQPYSDGGQGTDTATSSGVRDRRTASRSRSPHRAPMGGLVGSEPRSRPQPLHRAASSDEGASATSVPAAAPRPAGGSAGGLPYEPSARKSHLPDLVSAQRLLERPHAYTDVLDAVDITVGMPRSVAGGAGDEQRWLRAPSLARLSESNRTGMFLGLTLLELVNLRLTELPPHLPPGLVRLDVSGNEIATLRGIDECCPHLQVFNARRNRLTAIGATSFARCPELTHLLLGRNRIPYVEGLSHLARLETLDLSHTAIATDVDVRPLSANTALRHLLLEGTPLHARLVRVVGASVSQRVPGLDAFGGSAAQTSSSRYRVLLRNMCPQLLSIDGAVLGGGGGGGGAAGLGPGGSHGSYAARARAPQRIRADDLVNRDRASAAAAAPAQEHLAFAQQSSSYARRGSSGSYADAARAESGARSGADAPRPWSAARQRMAPASSASSAAAPTPRAERPAPAPAAEVARQEWSAPRARRSASAPRGGAPLTPRPGTDDTGDDGDARGGVRRHSQSPQRLGPNATPRSAPPAELLREAPDAQRDATGASTPSSAAGDVSISYINATDDNLPAEVRQLARQLTNELDEASVALRTCILILGDAPSTSAEAQRCVGVIKRSALLLDTVLPRRVVRYFAWTDDELNVPPNSAEDTSLVDSIASGELSGFSGYGASMRLRLLRQVHRLNDAKTCLRYITSLVEAGPAQQTLLKVFIQRVGKTMA